MRTTYVSSPMESLSSHMLHSPVPLVAHKPHGRMHMHRSAASEPPAHKEPPVHPRLSVTGLRKPARSCSIAAKHTPCRSVSVSESRAAVWTMDVGGVIVLMAGLAWQQRLGPRCTHCATIRASKPLLRFCRQNENPAPCMKEIVRAERGDESTRPMYYPIFMVINFAASSCARHAAQRCHRRCRADMLERPARKA